METVYNLIIIGAGPAGLEAAIQAEKAGLNYLLLDQKTAGFLIEDTMAEKKFLHVYGRNTATLRGDLPFPDRLKGQELVDIWKKRAETLTFKPHTKVLSVTKNGDQFTVATEKETFIGERILLTSGTFENPRKLGVPGENNNPNLFYTMDYYQDYENKNVIVVGGGNSALETAIHLADQNTVTLVIRKDAIANNVADNNRHSMEELVAEKKLTVLFNTTTKSLTETEATLLRNGLETTLPYDLFFVHAGFEQPTEFLRGMGIEIKDNKPVFNDQYETNVPKLYIAGALTGADSVIESANQSLDIVTRLTTI